MATKPGTVTYRDGIAILQLIIFPFVMAVALFIWNRTGWRVGGKVWRYPVTLSLIRIAGSISSLLTINHDSREVETAVVVCALIGLAPLLLTYVGLLRQIDTEPKMPPRFLNFLTIVGIVGLIVGIAGVSSSDGIHSNGIVKASMGIFLALFAIALLVTAWLFLQLRGSLREFQKKLFLATVLSSPFVLVRLVYSAMADYSNNPDFNVYDGNTTIYLCMDVLEEIVAMAITMALGMSAVRAKDFIKYTPVEVHSTKPGEV
ncbi:hypothetical protein BDV59DRAFT_201499 [Aspergillus ambiguus]|uniref:uncharacterized protein n=1 Tax=Aspergillus ambiguus TaxID=176160 RepID=UPI003CCCCE6E